MINRHHDEYISFGKKSLSSDENHILGLFDPSRLILRLKKDFSESFVLNSGDIKYGNLDQLNITEVLAMGTYLHELVHWWQFLGTTIGFQSLVAQPLRLFASISTLRRMDKETRLFKPLAAHCESGYKGIPENEIGLINQVVNDWYDLFFGQALLYNPNDHQKLRKFTFYENYGHALYMLVANTNTLLVEILGTESGLPNSECWDKEYVKIKKQLPQYSFGGNVTTPKIGLIEIFEGQARFLELQFLENAIHLTWKQAKERGMLSNPYTIAFNLFLDLSGLKRPNEFNSNIVDLFILICEIASIPNIAYPDELNDFSSFCDDYHPGARFNKICTAIKIRPSLISNFIDNSKKTYLAASQGICEYLKWDAPITIFEKIMNIANNSGACMELKQETGSLYSNVNPTMGILLRRHFDHVKDRFENPHRFCWPSKFMIRESGNNDDLIIQRKIEEKNSPIFTSKGLNGKARYVPPIDSPPDKSRDQMVAQGFIEECCLRDLMDQLVCEYGKFNIDLSWVSKNENKKQSEQMKKNIIRKHFGRNESDFGFIYKKFKSKEANLSSLVSEVGKKEKAWWKFW